jgi:hypothetical protein
MWIRIVRNHRSTRYPHRIQLLDLSEDLTRQGLPRDRSHELGTRGGPPEIAVRFRSPPLVTTERTVTVRIERRPYRGHSTLNWTLLLNGLREAIADFGVQLPNKGVLETRVRLWDEAEEADDLAEPPRRIATNVSRIVRDTELAQEIKEMHNFECQVCGYSIRLSDGRRYAEAHHIQPLGGGHNGTDVRGNIICVCPNHHAELDLCSLRISIAMLRRIPGHKIGARFIDYHNNLHRSKYGG